MTFHPLISAIDAAIVEHGWPDDVASLSLTNPPRGCLITATVTIGEIVGDGSFRGTAGTLTNALAAAQAEQAKYTKPMTYSPPYLRSVN